MRISTHILYVLVTLSTLFFACKKNEGQDNLNEQKKDETSYIELESLNYNGNILVAFTDGTSKVAQLKSGKLNLLPTVGGNKTVKSIQMDGKQAILIGRKENEKIKLKFENNRLVHRTAIDGFIPIGTYAEFQLINKDQTTLSQNYRIEADLDLLNEEWTPIGKSATTNPGTPSSFNGFSGKFDGGNHEIQNLNITTYGAYSGLFALTTAKSELINIKIMTGEIKFGKYSTVTGAIVGKGHAVKNCINYIPITITSPLDNNSSSTGGIAGTALIVESCKNFGNISGLHSTGGIVGSHYGSDQRSVISDCHNTGEIKGIYAGGIGGTIYGEIKNCSNTGRISTEISDRPFNVHHTIFPIQISLGGIAGSATNLTNCINKGEVSALDQSKWAANSAYIGGIAGGFALGGITQTTTKCKNEGKILVTMKVITIATTAGEGRLAIGGITGISRSISYSINSGEIRNSGTSRLSFTGGISGSMYAISPQTFDLTANGNYGDIIISASNEEHTFKGAGGVLGITQIPGHSDHYGQIMSCYNRGNIKLTVNSAGAGIVTRAIARGIKIQNCYNSGRITSDKPSEYGSAGIVNTTYELELLDPIEREDAVAYYLQNNFWTYYSDGIAESSSYREKGGKRFSAVAWPSLTSGWKIGNGGDSGNWKSLGSWNNSNPIYPKLYFEE